MATKQFFIQLTFERKAQGANGSEYTYLSTCSVDLAHGDIGAFIACIPDDVDEHSSIMVAVRRADGKVVAYADGMDYDISSDGSRGQMRDMSDLDGCREGYRRTAALFADRTWQPVRTNDED